MFGVFYFVWVLQEYKSDLRTDRKSLEKKNITIPLFLPATQEDIDAASSVQFGSVTSAEEKLKRKQKEIETSIFPRKKPHVDTNRTTKALPDPTIFKGVKPVSSSFTSSPASGKVQVKPKTGVVLIQSSKQSKSESSSNHSMAAPSPFSSSPLADHRNFSSGGDDAAMIAEAPSSALSLLSSYDDSE
jgi:hypothetical protein